MRRTIVPVFGDLHGGHKLALMSPTVTLYDETPKGEAVPYTPNLTASQRYLWELWTKDILLIRELAAGDEILPILNGEPCWGDKHPAGLVSTRKADQTEIAVANLSVWLDLPEVKHFRIATGTEAHNFGEGSAEFEIAKRLQAEYKDKDVKALNHGLLTINGVTIDYAHHGPTSGSRMWLRGNEARYYLRDIMLREITRRNEPPRVVCRAHFHDPVHETLRVAGHTSDLMITPSFLMLTDFARKVVKSPSYLTNGIAALEIVDGKLIEIHEFYETVDLRTEETL